MTTKSPAKPRPLSPHLGIYKPQISSVLSIMHRATGIALSLGLVLFVAWLVMLAGGEGAYHLFVNNILGVLGSITLYAVIFAAVCFGLCCMSCRILRAPTKLLKWVSNLAIFVIALVVTLGFPLLLEYLVPDSVRTIIEVIGQAVLFGLTWSFFYHVCCGIRHLFWDAGKFLSIRAMNITGVITLAVAAVMTLGLWIKIWGIVTW